MVVNQCKHCCQVHGQQIRNPTKAHFFLRSHCDSDEFSVGTLVRHDEEISRERSACVCASLVGVFGGCGRVFDIMAKHHPDLIMWYVHYRSSQQLPLLFSLSYL